MLIHPPPDLLGSLVAASEKHGRLQGIRATIQLIDGVLDQLDRLIAAEGADPPPCPTKPQLVR